MSNRIEVTVTMGDRKITFEGPEDFVRNEVQRLAGSPVNSAEGAADRSSMTSAGALKSERALLDEKSPQGHSETVAVLAFALKESGVTEFTEEDVRRAYLRANTRPPKVVGQAIRDAKNKFDYIEAGASKGTYRLSAHGDRTVLFDLPRKREAR